MLLKSKFRALLKDLMITIPEQNYKDKLINHQLIKNVIDDRSSLAQASTWPSCTNLLRILASDEDNAREISNLVEKNKAELNVQSVHVVNQAIDLSSKLKKELPYKSSVLIKLEPKEVFKLTFLNSNQEYWSAMKKEVLEKNIGKTERVVIDFSSPNIAKPFHYGHLKSTLLGNFLNNINSFLGNQVTKLNYIGDWGTQYGLLSLGLDELNEIESDETRSPLRRLLDVYVKANERAKVDQSFFVQAKKTFLAMDREGDPELLERWRKIRDLSLNELMNSYTQLGISFDAFEFESDYAKDSVNLVDSIMSKSFVTRLEDGVVVAQVEKNGRFFDVPLLKSDGASLYLTRDIAAAISRKKQYNFDKMLYIVGVDQEKHFHCLKEILKSMDFPWSDQLIHVKMGKVLGMSSRSGNFVLLSDIIERATKKYIEVTKDTPTSKVVFGQDIEDVGKHLASSALFVYDLRNSRIRHYEFDWDRVMLNSDRSGINLQTTFARLTSLIDKSSSIGLKPLGSDERIDSDALCCIEAANLASHLDELDTALHSSFWSMDPYYLTNHALELCKAINRARRSDRLRVIGESNEHSARTKLSLFKSAHTQLEFIIRLLGLKPLYKV